MRAVLVGVALCLTLILGEPSSGGPSHHGLDEIDFHSAGVETTSEQDQDQSVSNNTQVSHSSAGLAWDKHDFEVTNNKGGDVKVEVNLAAPMSTEGSSSSSDDDDGSDLGDMLKLLAPEDPINPIELMGMMKDLMATMKPDEPEFNMTDILNQFKASIPAPQPPPPQQDLGPLISALTDAIKESRSENSSPPQPPPMPNPETIIRALQPPPIIMPPASSNSFDPSSFMKELREAMAANKPPPVPPPGVDPALLDAIRDTLKEIKEMRQRAEATPQPIPPPPPPPQQPLPQTPPPAQGNVPPVELPPFYPPPPPPVAGSAPGNSPAEMKDLLQSMMDKMKPAPLPAFPTAAQDAALEELRAMIRAQQAQSSKPIILPPPVVRTNELDSHTIVAPPPPPPPTSADGFKDRLQEMIKGMIPAPQRIPAPPRITLKTESVSCCAASSPEDPRPEEVRCPRINGVRPPRCRRDQPPSVVPMKCKRGNCGAVDEDGDINVGETYPPHIPQKIAPSSFNPQKLLRALCPGGLCPEQRELDPRLNPRLAPEAAQTGSF